MWTLAGCVADCAVGIISTVDKGEAKSDIDAVTQMVRDHIRGNTLIPLTVTMRGHATKSSTPRRTRSMARRRRRDLQRARARAPFAAPPPFYPSLNICAVRAAGAASDLGGTPSWPSPCVARGLPRERSAQNLGTQGCISAVFWQIKRRRGHRVTGPKMPAPASKFKASARVCVREEPTATRGIGRA